jgi:hypothetical protein
MPRSKYTLDQLRSMLVGKKWSEFKRPKAYKYCRVLCIKGVFFTLRPRIFLLRPMLEVRADSQTVIFQLVSPETHFAVKAYLHTEHKYWSQVFTDLGYIITRIEGYEPVEATQDSVGGVSSPSAPAGLPQA